MVQIRLNSSNLSPSSTFTSGAGHTDRIGHYINCSSNPYDLRPAADIILGAAYSMRETMPDNQPLVILMGPMTSCWSKGVGGLYAYYFCQQKGCDLKGKSIRRDMIQIERKTEQFFDSIVESDSHTFITAYEKKPANWKKKKSD